MRRLLHLAWYRAAHYPLATAARSATLAVAAGALLVAAAAAAGLRRFEVTGASMLPTLEPGDRVMMVRARTPAPGQVVVVGDPRVPSRLIVKRVAWADGATVTVKGDNEVSSTDSRVFGPVSAASVVGRVVYRYHPGSRRGPVR